jgi:phosphoribosylformylglycinamidine cyclo-ligase
MKLLYGDGFNIKDVFFVREHGCNIRAIVLRHSGGGQTKVLHFVDHLHIIKDNLFPIPPLFQMIQEESKTPMQEMFKVFNMGHRMEIYCKTDIAEDLIAISKSFNVDAKIIGRVEASDKKQVTIKHKGEVYLY